MSDGRAFQAVRAATQNPRDKTKNFLSYVSLISAMRTAKTNRFPRCCRNVL